MKNIKPTPSRTQWPRQAVKSIECRKRDLVIRIADWTKTKDEPAFDVEVYIGGVYDFNESKTCARSNGNKSVAACKSEAIAYAQSQIAKLL
jgi:hypothetical protein